jgi:predicted nucleotidyltransferase
LSGGKISKSKSLNIIGSNILLFGLTAALLSNPESDSDVLATFSSDARWSLLDHVEMQDELKTIFGRNVDLVSRRGIERSRNPIRRKEILESAEVIYAAA